MLLGVLNKYITYLISCSTLVPIMATSRARAIGSLVPFNCSFKIMDMCVCLEDLLGLKFNLHIRTMYVKQEMYCVDVEILVMQNIRLMKVLCGFGAIGFLESPMYASTMLLTNKLGISTIKNLSVATIKLNVLMMMYLYCLTLKIMFVRLKILPTHHL